MYVVGGGVIKVCVWKEGGSSWMVNVCGGEWGDKGMCVEGGG